MLEDEDDDMYRDTNVSSLYNGIRVISSNDESVSLQRSEESQYEKTNLIVKGPFSLNRVSCKITDFQIIRSESL